MRHLYRFVVGVSSLFLAACVDDTTSPIISAQSYVLSEAETTAQTVASAIAQSLSRREARIAIRDAMRGSRVTEHKLVLQEFVRTSDGMLLASGAAEALGLPTGDFLGLVAQLPPMDFYAPYRKHRLSWTGSANVSVAATTQRTPTSLVVYHTSGRRSTHSRYTEPPDTPLLLLAPAERKSRRIGAQAARPGNVIQDPDDGEASGSILIADRAGHTTELQLAELIEADGWNDGVMVPLDHCTPEDITCEHDDEPDPIVGPADTTRINYFAVYFEEGSPGSMEVEFRATFFDENNNAVGSGVYRQEGVERFEGYQPIKPIIFQRMTEGSTERIFVRVIETDAFFDDDYGFVNAGYSDRNQILHAMDNCSHVYSSGCGGGVLVVSADIVLGWTPKF